MPIIFTPNAVNESATPDPNEVLVSGVDENNLPRNVLLRDAPGLRAQLIATPRTLPNPAYAALVAQLPSTPETIDDAPNPAYAALTEQIAATAPTIVNPDRASVEAQAFAAALSQIAPAPAP